MQRPLSAIILGIIGLLASPSPAALEAKAYIDRAVALIEADQHTLARTYLEPALIDYRLNAGERSRAYYLRGYSFFSQDLYVSARKDYYRALEFLPDNPVVLSSLGHLYFEGLGIAKDQPLAVELFRKAADAGYAPASMRLGFAYLTGSGAEQDTPEARSWLEQAAADGSTTAMRQLGLSYRAPLADPPDPGTARQWYERAWEAGDAEALSHIGFMIEAGELEPADEPARSYFERAAEAGSGLAQTKLAHLYLSGEDMPQDVEKARELFTAAADQGHAGGYLGLAYLYESGTGVTANPQSALQWYQRAAEAGSWDAQLRLAYLKLQGGDLQSHREATRWLAQAAASGIPKALNDYAWLLATSRFDEVRDGSRAVELAERAAESSRTPVYLDTLAAAYADTGNFEKALAIQREAIGLVAAEDPDLTAELNEHLAAFEAGEPWRE